MSKCEVACSGVRGRCDSCWATWIVADDDADGEEGLGGTEEGGVEAWEGGGEREPVEGLIHASSFLTMSMFGEWGSIFVVRMSKLLRCLRREDVREVGNVLDEGREGREDECA